MAPISQLQLSCGMHSCSGLVPASVRTVLSSNLWYVVRCACIYSATAALLSHCSEACVVPQGIAAANLWLPSLVNRAGA